MGEFSWYRVKPSRATVRLKLLASLAGLCLAMIAHQSVNAITVVDQSGDPLAYAVVEIISPGVSVRGEAAEPVAVIQENLTFVPFVTAVPVGTAVSFPNLDRTRHHVYSFSEAKLFELKLFVGHDHDPVIFNTPGIVAIGCNIHDYMQAYIYVAASPHVAVSDQRGHAALELPGHAYTLNVWHPWARGDSTVIQVASGQYPETIKIAVNREPLPAAPQGGLQDLFKP